MSKYKNITGLRSGKLIAIELTNYKAPNGVKMWLCRCDCGNTRLVEARRLTTQSTKYCEECSKKETKHYKDITGQKFGFLEAINTTDKRKHTNMVWNCFCHGCDTYHLVGLGELMKGQISCGCIKSKGEGKIKILLDENNIFYKKEFKFVDLLSDLREPLRFDFAIFKNNKLYYLIEFDGEQHFRPSGYLGGIEIFERLIHHDKLKNEYCLKNNIPLIRIPYTEYKNLNISMLKLETTNFLI